MKKPLFEMRQDLLATRKQMQQSIINELKYIDRTLQRLIDVLQPIRQNSPGGDKQAVSYVSRKVDLAAKSIGLALEKIEEQKQ